MSARDIFDIFTIVSAKEKFQVIEMEQSIATAVNKEPFSLKKMFMKCSKDLPKKRSGGKLV